jgi:hypothetical protein
MEKTMAKTVGACVIAPLIYVIGATIVGTLFALIQDFLTVLRPGIIVFLSSIVGGIAGMHMAKEVCDRLLQPYRLRPVFLVFAALVIAGSLFNVLYFPIEWHLVISFVQAVVAAVMAYHLFWTAEAE